MKEHDHRISLMGTACITCCVNGVGGLAYAFLAKIEIFENPTRVH